MPLDMKWQQLLLPTALLFFCLWTALLARFKGYSATCWLLGGGVVGVAVLCLLPAPGPAEPEKRTKGNRLGLFLSAASLSAACLWWVAR